MITLLLMIMTSDGKQVDVHYTAVPPRIDGIIEEVWQAADSLDDLVQFHPQEASAPEERTVVYVLQDEDNIYFAVRCHALKNPPVACLTKDEDYFTIGIDPFASGTMGYYFWIYGSRIKWDGYILDNGRTHDDSWEGVWYADAKIYDDHWDIEFKIPFKSIRYKKGLDTWGFQIMRYTATTSETDYWTEVSHRAGDLMSNWGTLKGVNPQSQGFYFELYPETYLRTDRTWYYPYDSLGSALPSVDSTKFKPRASLNLKWDITPQTTLNATAFPDFAQIEADPYTLNLGRYPVYLNERRPFFIEGRDIFRMSTLGEDSQGDFHPIELFYSRRIGKAINGDAVPILGGLKFTSKSERWNAGLLAAYADQYEKGTIAEPNRAYSVLRFNSEPMRNMGLGLLASGMYADTNDFNAAVGIDAIYRKGMNQAIAHAAFSDRQDKTGTALSAAATYFISNVGLSASAQVIGDSFDVTDIGYLPWTGRRQIYLGVGPVNTYREGALATLRYGLFGMTSREPGTDQWSKGAGLSFNPNFRNSWGCYLGASAGDNYEVPDSVINYTGWDANLSVWGRVWSQMLNFGGYMGRSFNWQRYFVARQASTWLAINYSVIPPLSVGVNVNGWFEWDEQDELLAITPRVRPNVFIRFSGNMSLNLFSEFVYIIDRDPSLGLDWESELYSLRSGLLFSWNFKPKSWIYFALNDYRSENGSNVIEPRYEVGALKLKYLFYF